MWWLYFLSTWYVFIDLKASNQDVLCLLTKTRHELAQLVSNSCSTGEGGEQGVPLKWKWDHGHTNCLPAFQSK